MYFFCAWNLLAYVGYQYYNREELGIKLDTDETLGLIYFNKGSNSFSFNFIVLYMYSWTISEKSQDSECYCLSIQEL